MTTLQEINEFIENSKYTRIIESVLFKIIDLLCDDVEHFDVIEVQSQSKLEYIKKYKNYEKCTCLWLPYYKLSQMKDIDFIIVYTENHLMAKKYQEAILNINEKIAGDVSWRWVDENVNGNTIRHAKTVYSWEVNTYNSYIQPRKRKPTLICGSTNPLSYISPHYYLDCMYKVLNGRHKNITTFGVENTDKGWIIKTSPDNENLIVTAYGDFVVDIIEKNNYLTFTIDFFQNKVDSKDLELLLLLLK